MSRPLRVFKHSFLNITQINSPNFTEIWQFYTFKLQVPFEAVCYGGEISECKQRNVRSTLCFLRRHIEFSEVDRCSLCLWPHCYDCYTNKHEKIRIFPITVGENMAAYARFHHCVTDLTLRFLWALRESDIKTASSWALDLRHRFSQCFQIIFEDEIRNNFAVFY